MQRSAGTAIIILSGVIIFQSAASAEAAKSISALIENAFSAEETARKVEAFNLCIEDLSRSGLSVPPELSEKAAVMNAAAKSGHLEKKAEQAHSVALAGPIDPNPLPPPVTSDLRGGGGVGGPDARSGGEGNDPVRAGGIAPGGEEEGRAGVAAAHGGEPGEPAPERALEPDVGAFEDNGLVASTLMTRRKGPTPTWVRFARRY